MNQTTPASAWADLVSTALVGTARRAVPEPAGLPSVPGADPARTLLDRAAQATLQRRAGLVPRRVAPIDPAPGESAPVVGAAAARRLATMLGGTGVDLLPEWLALAADTGHRVPPESLPDLLARAERHAELRAPLARVAGVRGAWLARLNPDWAFLRTGSAPFDAARWDHGTAAQRRAHLAVLRAHDPAAARELLDAAWPTERAGQRRRLLEVMTDGLSADDEPLLARAAGDRSANVRAEALGLLARLPGSRHGAAVAEQARLLVRPGDGAPLDVGRPEPAPETAPLLDITAGGDSSGSPVSADRRRRDLYWAVVVQTPLPVWPGHLGLDPGAIGEAARTAGMGDLLDALAVAAVLQRDPVWARALIGPVARRHGFDEDNGIDPRALLRNGRGGSTDLAAALLNVLPEGERCAAVQRWALAAGAVPPGWLLRRPWTDEFSVFVVDALRGARPRNGTTAWYTATLLCDAAARFMPPEFHDRLPCDEGEHFAVLADRLRLRSTMHKELL
ncbi:hypothetical protein CLV63_12358 [Murinocardiopsis flavida]|uniref:Uncharacterized protein n=1 Tax=Murinocardiopsis flavida TaxID=645275 RepID=A0A2P8CZ32_9ACTN|nr:DUF5691 domain-containing protein [Murinocardiopsis flavida]PSK90229.1 hypothetical protein CLV63_12358 [Murinocardiopsis flavida]